MSEKKNRRRFLADALFAASGLSAAALLARAGLSADPPRESLAAPPPPQAKPPENLRDPSIKTGGQVVHPVPTSSSSEGLRDPFVDPLVEVHRPEGRVAYPRPSSANSPEPSEIGP